MTRYAKKTDLNQSGIVDDLRKIPGLEVTVLSHIGWGVPDIHVKYREKYSKFWEIKDEKGELTVLEKWWQSILEPLGAWGLARDVETIFKDIGLMAEYRGD